MRGVEGGLIVSRGRAVHGVLGTVYSIYHIRRDAS